MSGTSKKMKQWKVLTAAVVLAVGFWGAPQGAGAVTAVSGTSANDATTAASATETNATAVGDGATASYTGTVAVGGSAQAKGNYSVVVGYKANTSKLYSIAIGGGGDSTNPDYAAASVKSERAIAIGTGSSVAADSNLSVALGYDSEVTGALSTALGAQSMALADLATAVGRSAIVHAEQGTALGTDASAYAFGASAVGFESKANRQSAIAIGQYATAGVWSTVNPSLEEGQGVGSIAIGSRVSYKEYDEGGSTYTTVVKENPSQAYADYAIALGTASHVKTDATNSLALGYKSSASVANAVALGANSLADTENTISVGSSATTGGFTRKIVNVTAGSSTTDAANYGQLVDAQADTTSGTTTYTPYEADSNGLVTVKTNDGGTAFTFKTATATSSLVIGDETNHWVDLSWNGTADSTSVTRGANSTAYGYLANASGSSSTAIGYGASATAANAVALGQGSVADTANTISVGSSDETSGFTRKIVNVTAGTNTTDAANYGQLVKNATYTASNGSVTIQNNTDGTAFTINGLGTGGSSIVDYDTNYVAHLTGWLSTDFGATDVKHGTGSTAYGYGANASAQDSVAIGASTSASGVFATAVGFKASASAIGTIAIGGFGGRSDDDITKASGRYSIAIGTAAIADGEQATALGVGSNAYTKMSTALGDGATVGTSGETESGGVYGVAVGKKANVTADKSVALGYQSSATAEDAVALGQGSVADIANTISVGSSDETSGFTRKIVNVSNGSANTDAATYGQIVDAQAVTDETSNTTTYTPYEADTNGLVTVKTNDGGTAFTFKVGTSSTDSGLVIGDETNHWVDLSWNGAADDTSVTRGKNSTAYGYKANASGDDSTAIGYGAGAIGGNSVAIGVDASAGTEKLGGQVAIGREANATGIDALALGTQSASAGNMAVAFGPNSSASGNGAIAFGYQSSATVFSSIAAGYKATVGTEDGTDGIGGIAIGGMTTSDGTTAGASVTANHGIALGTSSSVTAMKSLALGYGSSATAANAVALGQGSVADTANTISVGSSDETSGFTRKIVNVSNGSANTDAATYGQIVDAQAVTDETSNTTTYTPYEADTNGLVTVKTNDGGTAFTFKVGTSSTDSGLVIGDETKHWVDLSWNGAADDTSVTRGDNSTAYGYKANAAGNIATAIGYGANASDANSIAIGYDAKASNFASIAIGTARASGQGATAIGAVAYAIGTQAMALGATSRAYADNSLALGGATVGKSSTTDGVYGIAVGGYAKVSADNSVAIGFRASATAENAVALGQGSVADTANTISVGSSSSTRKIVNVTAGTNTTDAVNYGQIIAKNTYSPNANGIVTIKTNSGEDAFYIDGIGSGTYDGVVYSGSETIMIDGDRKISAVTGDITSDAETLVTGKTVYNALLELEKKIGQSGAGSGNTVSGEGSGATGKDNKVDGDKSSATGDNNTVNGNESSATGSGNEVDGTGSSATGDQNNVTGDDSTATGKGNIIGKEETPVDNSSATGNKNEIYSDGSSATGDKNIINKDAEGSNATGTGNIIGGTTPSEGTGKGSSATGNNNTIYGENATAVGDDNIINKDAEGSTAIGKGNEVSGKNAVAEGLKNVVSGEGSVAGGSNNNVSGAGSAAYGIGNTVSGDGSGAYGSNNNITGANTYALGSDITSAANNSVILGAGSTATRDNVVSVGSVGGERQIINVAAGTEITDAVNYGQIIAKNTYSPNAKGIVTIKTNSGEDAFYIDGIGSGTYDGVVYSGSDTITIDGDRKISVNATGKVAEGDKGVVTGDSVYQAIVKNDEYKASDGKVEIKNNAGNTAFTITGLATSAAEVGDTTKLSQAGLGDNVSDSILSVNDKVGILSDDINKVGAGAAALAALHPEAYNPNEKLSFAVGYGHYKNANAGAIGAFFKPNADMTVSVAGTVGNGDSMLNAGFSFRLGKRGKKMSTYRSSMDLVERIDALEAEMSREIQRNNIQDSRLDTHDSHFAAQDKKISQLQADIARMQQQLAILLSDTGVAIY